MFFLTHIEKYIFGIFITKKKLGQLLIQLTTSVSDVVMHCPFSS